MPQRDLMLGWIEDVARAVGQLLGGPDGPKVPEAASKVDAALAQHLAGLAPLLPQLDVASAAALLHEPERLFGYAQLLALQADVRQQEHLDVEELRMRAIALARVALARATEPPSSWREWIAELEAAPGPAPRG